MEGLRLESVFSPDSLPPELRLPAAEQDRYLEQHGIVVEQLRGGALVVSANRMVPDRQTTHILFSVRAGAINDPPGKEGSAHLLEHGFMGGSDAAKDEREQTRLFAYGGYSIRPVTGPISVTFDLDASSGLASREFGVEPGIRNLLALIFRPKLEEAHLRKEIATLTDEAQGNKLRPMRQVRAFINETLFPANHIMRTSVEGTGETLAAISLEDLKQYWKRYFIPPNISIEVISEGRQENHDRVMRILRECWEEYATEPFGTRNQKPDRTSLEGVNGFKQDGFYQRAWNGLPGRTWVGAVSLIKAEPYTVEGSAFSMAVDILGNEVFGMLRGRAIGYSPLLLTDRVPYRESRVIAMGIGIDKSKLANVRNKLRGWMAKMILEAIQEELAERKIQAVRNAAADSPIGLDDRVDSVFEPLTNCGQLLRIEDLQKIALSVKPADVNRYLDNLTENPGALFVFGDID